MPRLCQLLEENEFDLVGLANLPDDDGTLMEHLRIVGSRLDSGQENLIDREELAGVLYTLVRVAQDDYGQDGPKYWPHLQDRIRRALGLPWFALDGKAQSTLGRWFRNGLEAFGYPIPWRGRKNIEPILWHAGCPRHSLPSLIPFVAECVAIHGEAALEADAVTALQLAELAQRSVPPLHRTVVRLVTDNPQGAAELWCHLAAVVQCFREGDEARAREAWGELPGVDFEQILAALQNLDRPALAGMTNSVRHPRLRYDPRSGEVRLWLMEGSAQEWEILGLSLRWEKTSALLVKPVPAEYTVRHLPSGREWHEVVRMAGQPVAWFRFPSGQLERADDVERRGLEAGPWYLLAKGQPEGLIAEHRRPLEWSYLEGGEGWAAWEIDLPARGAKSVWTLTLDGHGLDVSLARRSAARVQFPDSPAVMSQTAVGDQISVYTITPRARAGDRPVLARLLRRHGTRSTLVETVTITAGTERELPVQGPGVYQLREARGSGRVLLDFALLPDFRAERLPMTEMTAGMHLTAPLRAGQFNGANLTVTGPGRWRIDQSSVLPWITADWEWVDGDGPALRMQWPVPALRWRLIGLTDQPGEWTREPIVVDRRKAVQMNARLEVQVPPHSALRINGQLVPADDLQPIPPGNVVQIKLVAYAAVEEISLWVARRDHLAVLLGERPRLRHFNVRRAGNQVEVCWTAAITLPATTVLAVWNPCDPAASLIPVPLDSAARLAQRWAGPWWPALGDTAHASVCLAARAGQGFGCAAARWLPATGVDGGGSIISLVCRSAEPAPAWVNLAHDWGVRFRFGDSAPGGRMTSLNAAATLGELPWSDARCFLRGLGTLSSASDSNGWQQFRAELLLFLDKLGLPTRELNGAANPTGLLLDWLEFGIHPGWRPAAEYAQVGTGASHYPFGYFRDLWLLDTAARPAVERQAAAKRVLELHRNLGLFHPAKGLPLARFAGLPLTQQALRFEKAPADPHCHHFRLAEPTSDTDRAFIDQVVGDECCLRLIARQDDQFPRSSGPPPLAPTASLRKRLRTDTVNYEPTQYDAAWFADDLHWEVDRFEWSTATGRMGSQPCCRPTGPMLVPAWDGEELIRQLALRDWLMQPRAATHSLGQVECWQELNSCLFAQEDLGAVHRHMIEPPPMEPRVLFGRSLGTLPAYQDLPPAAKVAWSLAWIDRLVAWQGSSQVFGAQVKLRGQFQQLLQAALKRSDPVVELLTGCLVAAEFVLYILRGHGLGPAFRFAPAT